VEEIATERIMKSLREKGTILLGVLAIVASAVLLQASMPFESAMTSLQELEVCLRLRPVTR